MNDKEFEIIPKTGYGKIKFGDPSEVVIKELGQPEDVENIEDEDVFNTVILYYWSRKVTVFFEGREKSVVSCFETENTSSTLYGKPVFALNEAQIRKLMKEMGFPLAEEEIEITGEKRISYDDAMIDFFFQDDKLTAVNWGVLINESGEVEEF